MSSFLLRNVNPFRTFTLFLIFKFFIIKFCSVLVKALSSILETLQGLLREFNVDFEPIHLPLEVNCELLVERVR